jgi:Ca2+-binding EF-hand superfamily protein
LESNFIISFSFERELKNKLGEKTKGAQSEQQVLMKAFKYFDLNDNGSVEPDEFAKAIEKIGIQIPTQKVSFRSFLVFSRKLVMPISVKFFF